MAHNTAKKTGLLSPAALLRQNAIAKGVLGGRRGWLVVGAFMWGPRLVRRFMGRQEEMLTTERLKPGETITIMAIRPATRAERKAAARAR